MALEIEFLSSKLLSEKKGQEKISFILYQVKDGKILILEEPLTPQEEAKLIEEAMIGVNVNNNFKGIEIATMRDESKSLSSKIAALLGIKKGITIIGPAAIIKKMKREKDPQKLLLSVVENM